MLPCPTIPRAEQSRLWQNWVCGSIGGLPRGWFGDQTWRDARWTRAFQEVEPRSTVAWGGTGVVLGDPISAAVGDRPAGRLQGPGSVVVGLPVAVTWQPGCQVQAAVASHQEQLDEQLSQGPEQD